MTQLVSAGRQVREWMRRVSRYLRSSRHIPRDRPADPEPLHLVDQRVRGESAFRTREAV